LTLVKFISIVVYFPRSQNRNKFHSRCFSVKVDFISAFKWSYVKVMISMHLISKFS